MADSLDGKHTASDEYHSSCHGGMMSDSLNRHVTIITIRSARSVLTPGTETFNRRGFVMTASSSYVKIA